MRKGGMAIERERLPHGLPPVSQPVHPATPPESTSFGTLGARPGGVEYSTRFFRPAIVGPLDPGLPALEKLFLPDRGARLDGVDDEGAGGQGRPAVGRGD